MSQASYHRTDGNYVGTPPIRGYNPWGFQGLPKSQATPTTLKNVRREDLGRDASQTSSQSSSASEKSIVGASSDSETVNTLTNKSHLGADQSFSRTSSSGSESDSDLSESDSDKSSADFHDMTDDIGGMEEVCRKGNCPRASIKDCAKVSRKWRGLSPEQLDEIDVRIRKYPSYVCKQNYTGRRAPTSVGVVSAVLNLSNKLNPNNPKLRSAHDIARARLAQKLQQRSDRMRQLAVLGQPDQTIYPRGMINRTPY